MKLVRIALWFLALCALGQFLPIERADHYDLSHAKYRWLKREIFGSRQQLDLVFIGSSHTMLGVSPHIIQDALGTQKPINNYAVNWIGRDMDYALVRDLLEHHSVANMVVEVRSTEEIITHKWFRFLGRGGDFFHPGGALVALVDLRRHEMTQLSNLLHLLLRPPVLLGRKLAKCDFDYSTYEATEGWHQAGNASSKKPNMPVMEDPFNFEPYRPGRSAGGLFILGTTPASPAVHTEHYPTGPNVSV